MINTCRKIAFASGKGGVGKTLLAANFAHCASTIQRTLLIDFDFQNQGASGLLARYLKVGCLNAFDLLTSNEGQAASPLEIRPNLFFAPAFDPSKSDRTSPLHSVTAETFDRALEMVLAAGNYQTVIVDCHGGLDDTSFAAFISSDTTFIVTEADKVTFNGTLELLDFYISRAAALAPELDVADASDQSSAIAHDRDRVSSRISHIEDNKVRFLVNRVSGKYSYDVLSNLLSRQFYANIAALRNMNQGFSFIPADPLAAESFSEHPFYVELMPEAILSQKIELLCLEIFGQPPKIAGRSKFYRLSDRIDPSKLQRVLRSSYEVRVQAVFSFIAVSQLLFLCLGAVVLVAKLSPVEISDLNPLGSLTFLGLGLFLIYMATFNLSINGYYRDRMRYESRLHRYGGRDLSIAFSVRLVRLFLFRLVLLWLAVTFLFSGVTYIIVAVVALFSPRYLDYLDSG
jgi:MinD-like ATPase involved in chromosome partitioning or flagellar assembly